MTAYAFVALGFDPAPGDPEVLLRAGAGCSRLGTDLDDDAARARGLRDGFTWSGRAADAFRDRLSDVPQDLRRAGEAQTEAGAALTAYALALRGHQCAARLLEDQAREHQAVADGGSPAGGTDGRAQAAQHALGAMRAQALDLREAVLRDAGRCSRALHDATRHAPKPPGWLAASLGWVEHVAGECNAAVGDFVRSHAAAIEALADVCAKVSSALAVTAMLLGPVPVLGEAVGAVALAGSVGLGLVSLAGHTALACWAGGSWTAVALDAVALATAGGGRAATAVGSRIAAARGLEVEAGESLVPALRTLAHPGQALARGATATMTFPTLVTRTVSYQFDLAGGAVGVVDLAATGSVPREVREAGERGQEPALVGTPRPTGPAQRRVRAQVP